MNGVYGGDGYCFRPMCVCVCVCVYAAASNANSSKMVKATDFKFDQRVSRDSPGRIPLKFLEKGALPGSRDPLSLWLLNANSSKTVKATCMFPGQSRHDPLKI